MVSQIIFQVTAIIGRWKIDLDTLLRILLLNKLQRWYEVTVSTHKYNTVCGIKNTVCYHSNGNVHIGLLFFRT